MITRLKGGLQKFTFTCFSPFELSSLQRAYIHQQPCLLYHQLYIDDRCFLLSVEMFRLQQSRITFSLYLYIIYIAPI